MTEDTAFLVFVIVFMGALAALTLGMLAVAAMLLRPRGRSMTRLVSRRRKANRSGYQRCLSVSRSPMSEQPVR